MSVAADRSGKARERGLGLAVLSFFAGGASGILGATFRRLLEWADRFRSAIIPRAHGLGLVGFLLVVAGVAAAAAIAAWLVRRFAPEAEGSGIPHVEAVLNGKEPPAPARLIPIKFVGGLLAIGGGLALGREGPTIQMGASTAHLLGKAFRRSREDCRVLLAAGAGAGLATAFNSPIAGAVFVLEELVRRFETRIAIAALGASAGAIGVARLLLGHAPDFRVAPQPYSGFGTLPAYLVFGLLAGFLGVAYNRLILGALSAADRLGLRPEGRAALVGGAVGLLSWFVPDLVGGGDAITQRTLAGAPTLLAVSLVFLLRFGLGPVSYAAGTPGGLFAPMLVLGAQVGLLVGMLFESGIPGLTPHPAAFAVVGMAAFFTAVVRAPVTGIVLVTEMTGSFALLLPMLGTCFAAMLVPALLGEPPIYDSLSRRAGSDPVVS
jgi:chloride channel protein, CIC family